jgi:hypothetical protein
MDITNKTFTQLFQFKSSLFFKGSRFLVELHETIEHGFMLTFTDIDTGKSNLLVTQKNLPRCFRSLDSIYNLLSDLSKFNDLEIELNITFC